MKKALFIAAGVLLVVIVILVGGFALVYFKGIGTGAKAVEVPNAAVYVAPTATPKGVSGPPSGPGPIGTVVPGATATPAVVPVSFDLVVQQTKPAQSSVLLNATVKVSLRAELTNRGTSTAHDVKVTARARVGKDYVSIDGKQALVIDLGVVGARARVVRDVAFELRMSLSQGRTAESDGIYFEIVTTSAEATSYMPLMRCNQVECAPAPA